jgi:type I restriction enzyme S subunit
MSKIDARYGAFGIAPNETDSSIITGNFWAYDVDETIMNINWFNQYTNSKSFYDLCERASSGITHRKYLNEDFFLNHQILIPDINEQESHVKYINGCRKICNEFNDENTLQLHLIKKFRQQVLMDTILGKLLPHDYNTQLNNKLHSNIIPEEIPFEISDKLEWCRLGEVCRIEKGNVGITKAIRGKYPLIALSEERLSHNDYQFDCKGVIIPLISSTGHGHASMKRIHYQEGKFSVGNILCCIYPFIDNVLNEKFLFHYLDTFKQDFFVNKMKGAANVSLKISSIADTPIPIVPLSIQDKFIQLMDTSDKLEKSIHQNQKYLLDLLEVALQEALEPKG